MSQVNSTTMPTRENAPEVVRAQLTPVDCAPWCEDGNGHVNQIMPEDQTCFGEPTTVTLTSMPPVTFEQSFWLDNFKVYLMREYNAIDPWVIVSRDDGPGAHLTPREAIAMGEALVSCGRQALAQLSD